MSKGFISDNLIEEIKDRCDIVEVISEYVQLSLKGKNYIGLCPFHDDTNPSFYVSRERRIFKCFACNSAGDVFTFLMKHQKLTYPEAVRLVAEKYGINIPQLSQNETTVNLRESIHKLNAFAVEYYHKLLTNSPAGKPALEYLRNRGIEDDTIENFKLGYSLPSWDDFLNSARKAKFSLDDILKAGFILQGKKEGSYYDRFRGRIMFPIFNTKGEPIGFGGRILDNDASEAKYINSPETPLYVKSRSLYNLNLAQNPIQKEGYAILAEGYMDVISCFQAGIHNIIASLGTSLSEGHVRLIKRYTDEVVIAYDSDKAGTDATSRGLDLLIKGDVRVKVLTIPSGKDPDDFIRANGAEVFRKLVKSAVDLIDYKLQRVNEYENIKNIEGKKRAVSELIATLANMNNEIERSEYVKKCAERLEIEEEYIWRELRKFGIDRRIKHSTIPKIPAEPKRSAKENIERLLIECLIQFPQFISQTRSILTKDDFSNPSHAELIELLWNNNASGEGGLEIGNLINKCENKESRDILSGLILCKSPLPNGEAQFIGCIKKMVEFRMAEIKKSIINENVDSQDKARKIIEIRQKLDSIIESHRREK